MSRSAAAAAISEIGSITPCGYCGAEPTSSTVLSSIAFAIASTSALKSGRTSMRRGAEVVELLVERRVRGHRQDDVRLVHVALVRGAALRGFDRNQDRLGTTRAQEAGGALVTGEEGRREVEDVVRHAPQRRERVRVQRVVPQVRVVRLSENVFELFVDVEHQA